MDRKQQIQNQIAELQRELALEVDGFKLNILQDGEVLGEITTMDLTDASIIDALREDFCISDFADDSIDVSGTNVDYEQTFHITKVVSYNITPF